jgi:ABC-type phosphate/phosphonate transport system substrate-binding protein
MYGGVPRALAAWRALFARVFADAGVAVELIEHRAPLPIADLWSRPDLCCDFMCGWPFVRSGRMRAIAAPVPSPPRYEHQSRYCSEFLVREASGWTTLADTFGRRFGWMSPDSQSGFNAPRAHLARYVSPERESLFAEVRGPLGSPMQALGALRTGSIDVTALDSFWLDLVRHHEPSKLEGIRCVETTPWTPMPLLVAAPGVDEPAVARLSRHLTGIHGDPSYRTLLADVLLERFVAPDVASYGELDAMARFAIERDYESIR